MNNNCFKLLRSLDIFGAVIPLQIQGANTMKTLLGFIVTLCVGLIGMSAFVYLVKDMSDRQSPVVYEHTLQTFEKYDGHTFLPGQFISTVTVGDQEYNPIINTIDKTYFSVRYKFCHGNANCWFVSSQNCLSSMADYLFEQFQLNKTLTKLSYCLNQTYWETEPVTLEGTYLSVNFKRVEIEVERCVNRTDNNYSTISFILVCATTEEMDDKLNKSFIIYGIEDSSFDRNNFEHPFRRDFQYFIQTIHFDSPQTAYMRYNVAEVTSIENYLLLWPKTTTNKALQFSDSFVDVGKVDPGVLGSSMFTLTMKRNFKEREYKNIVQAFGTIGGLLSLVISVARIFMIPFNWIALRLYLLNEQDEQQEDSDKSTTKSRSKIWKILRLQESRSHFLNKSKEAMNYLEVQQVINAVQYFTKLQQSQGRMDIQSLQYLNSVNNPQRQDQQLDMQNHKYYSKSYQQLSQVSSVPSDPQVREDNGRIIINQHTLNKLRNKVGECNQQMKMTI